MAQVDYFLKIDGIEGEAPDKTHKAEIEIESWSWGETNSGSHGSGGGGGAGKVSMQDFHFVMKMNKASGKLFLACANGEHIKQAILTCRKAGKDQQEYLKITFHDLLVSHYGPQGTAVDSVPLEAIALNFAKFEIEYKQQQSDGTLAGPVKTGYDLKKMQSV